MVGVYPMSGESERIAPILDHRIAASDSGNQRATTHAYPLAFGLLLRLGLDLLAVLLLPGGARLGDLALPLLRLAALPASRETYQDDVSLTNKTGDAGQAKGENSGVQPTTHNSNITFLARHPTPRFNTENGNKGWQQQTRAHMSTK